MNHGLIISFFNCCTVPVDDLITVPQTHFAEGPFLSAKDMECALYSYMERAHEALPDCITVSAPEYHHAPATSRMICTFRPRKAAFQRIGAVKGTQILHNFAILRI